MIKIIVIGAKGRMGQAIITEIYKEKDLEFIGGIETKEYIDLNTENKEIILKDNLEEIISLADVIVDFTTPLATLSYLPIIEKNKKPVIIGTTGFSEEQQKQIKMVSLNIPCVFSPNMSIGINLLFKIIKDLASVLKEDYDIEIIEAHHRNKKDAPSGTAKKMVELIAGVYNWNPEEVALYGRKGITGQRKAKEIGVHAIRAGDIIGDHTIIFGGNGERIEITHCVHNRTTFAKGVIKAIRFIIKTPPGLYTMQDVLNI